MDLPNLRVHQGSDHAIFHGSWYRGKHTNFIPSKANLAEPDAFKKYVLDGWLPKAPFIDKSVKITAFGSCFAHHLTKFLSKEGYNLSSRNLNLQSHIIRFGEGMVNTFAIRQQLEWALEGKEFPEALWFGPNKEIALPKKRIREETAEIISTTDIFIITLGLSEIWYSKRSGEAFWRAIPEQFFNPEDHGFRISSVEENEDNLEHIWRIIRCHRKNARLILTLSPVPLMATFRPISCITASSVSKAILRVAIDTFMRTHEADDCYYFPSYEMIRNVFPDPYKDDNRHPKQEIIESVLKLFVDHYCKSSELTPTPMESMDSSQ